MSSSMPPPWSPSATLALALALIALLTGVEAAAGLLYALSTTPAGTDPYNFTQLVEHYQQQELNGDFLSLILLLRSGLGITGIIWLCRLRVHSMVKSYLAIKPINWKQILFGIIGLIMFIVSTEFIYEWIDRDTAPEFMQEVYDSTQHLALLWFAIILVAPLFEELLFRGFIYVGLTQTRWGQPGAIIVTALLFAVSHLQYDWPEMIIVFILGIVLGLARWRSGSILLPMLLHCLNNIAATLQIAN